MASFGKAAAEGSGRAVNNLGNMYAAGQGRATGLWQGLWRGFGPGRKAFFYASVLLLPDAQPLAPVRMAAAGAG